MTVNPEQVKLYEACWHLQQGLAKLEQIGAIPRDKLSGFFLHEIVIEPSREKSTPRLASVRADQVIVHPERVPNAS